jgi:hypothetical protein
LSVVKLGRISEINAALPCINILEWYNKNSNFKEHYL